MRRTLTLILVAAAFAVALAAATADRWVVAVLDPGEFDPQATPSPPDYDDESAWAALPETVDGADVFLPGLPAIDPAAATVDVFYLHPTTWLGPAWNGPFDDPEVVEATRRGATLIQASAFNACCAVYAPRYRQANGNAFLEVSADGDRAIALAYGDVLAAFAAFQSRRGSERPFILASHSQGSVLAARLLTDQIWAKQAQKQLVAAYLVGGPIWPETLGGDVPVCDSPTQVGCVVGWNARGPRYGDNALEFENREAPRASDPVAGRICVNPITWRSDDIAAPASQHAGAVFFDAETPAVIPEYADAACSNGRLLITEIGDPPRDFMSTILDWLMGPENYHPIEYQLFYVNLRENALERVGAFLEKGGA